MHGPKTLKYHADLVDRMARTVGVDLEGAVLDGTARFDDLADAVLRCADCSDPGHCARWLAEAETRDQPPGYCRNGDLFAALKTGAAS